MPVRSRTGTGRDCVVVVNAGSSSLKFSLFFRDGTGWAVDARGQVEGIGTAPRFSVKDTRRGEHRRRPVPPDR